MNQSNKRLAVAKPSIPTNKRLEVSGPQLLVFCCWLAHSQLKWEKSLTIQGPTESLRGCWRYNLEKKMAYINALIDNYVIYTVTLQGVSEPFIDYRNLVSTKILNRSFCRVAKKEIPCADQPFTLRWGIAARINIFQAKYCF